METVIISLGGSIIIPDEIDTKFLAKFRELILSYIKKGNRVVLFCGGGSVARKYQKALSSVIPEDHEAQDWLGISATGLNAFLMKCLFHEYAENEVVSDPTAPVTFKKKILVCSGWKPGWSTDYDAVLMAKNIGASLVVNMTNVPQVYDKDPKKHKDAKPLAHISWEEFKVLVGDSWKPGLNMPFDPIASREASLIGLTVIIAGPDVSNLSKVLSGTDFVGTVIQ